MEFSGGDRYLLYGAPLQSVELALFPPFPYRELIQRRRKPRIPQPAHPQGDGACMLVCYSQRIDQALLLPLWCFLGGHICLDPGNRKSGSGYTAGIVSSFVNRRIWHILWLSLSLQPLQHVTAWVLGVPDLTACNPRHR